ncbi:VWA domain-containing protein [Crossiella equi]|nr:vWA domain-containing protein [Crossiella equi]
MAFVLRCGARHYLPVGDRLLSVLLEVTGDGAEAAGQAPEAAEVILVDCSGSMSLPPTKLAAARKATSAAVDALRDGVHFALVQGTGRAHMLYPDRPELVRATPETRAAARRATTTMVASGGTAMGSWLLLARDLLAAHPGAIRHAVLLTDGQNVGETAAQLDRVLAACTGEFTCDARGIGADWEPRELHRIASALRGRADAVRRVGDLARDFTGMVTEAMRKVVVDVRLRVACEPGVRLCFARQVFPVEADLGEPGPEISAGSWGAGTRHFHLGFEFDGPGEPTGEDLPFADVELAVVPPGGVTAEPTGQQRRLTVQWTDDSGLSSQYEPVLAHYARQTELRRLVQAGCAALDRGEHPDALDLLGRAVRLAQETGNHEQLGRLGLLVHVEDAAAGRVRLREGVSAQELRVAEAGSVLSAFPDLPVEELAADLPDRVCACCGLSWPGQARFCEETGRELPR